MRDKMRPLAVWLIGLLTITAINSIGRLHGAEQGPDALSTPFTVSPNFLRIDVADAASAVARTLTLELSAPATLLAIETDCGCVRSDLPVPQPLAIGVTSIPLTVLGVFPGTKRVTLRTTRGSASVIFQVVTPGLGVGANIAALVVQRAHAEHLAIVAVVHDLRGEIRNCGCSSGSLGGIDHLAALQGVLPGARLVLTGDVDGGRPAVRAALLAHGWESAPADIPTSVQPLEDLGRQGITAIVQVAGEPVANQRVLAPVLDRGAIAILLLLDARGTIVEQRLLPIDRTLPSAALDLAPPLTPELVPIHSRTPGAAGSGCVGCHEAAHATWEGSAHARAFASLAPADQVTDCASCHSSPGSSAPAGLPVGRSADVTCLGCHQQASAHASIPQSVRAGAVTDCRSCHDARHDPGFDPIAAWLRIQHTRQ